jgi:hypothetical protein
MGLLENFQTADFELCKKGAQKKIGASFISVESSDFYRFAHF